jgi:putative flippase GtrA
MSVRERPEATATALAPSSSLRRHVRSLFTWTTVRYAINGSATTLLYIVLTLMLDGPGGLPIQVAIPVAYILSLVVNFTLQRAFVFSNSGGFALSRRAQLTRYGAAVLVQYVITATSTAKLPGLLGLHEREVYVVTVLCLALCAFLTLRSVVFHAADA